MDLLTGRLRSGGKGFSTHVTSNEIKKRSATFVYPNAALFASITVRLLRCAIAECDLGVTGGSTSDLAPTGAEPIATEYWSYPFRFLSGCSLSGMKKPLDTLGEWTLANSLVTETSVVLKLCGVSMCTGSG